MLKCIFKKAGKKPTVPNGMFFQDITIDMNARTKKKIHGKCEKKHKKNQQRSSLPVLPNSQTHTTQADCISLQPAASVVLGMHSTTVTAGERHCRTQTW